MTASISPIRNVDQLRQELSLAYRMLAAMGMDDLTYTHLSARIPEKAAFLIQPFGMLFEEVTPEALIEVSFDGEVVYDAHQAFNHTGYVIHGSIYKARPDINASFHLHTIDGVAVSAMEDGLLPISQFALHFYNRISYHNYGSLALQFHGQGSQVAADLGQNKAMLLRNHGTLTCGETLQEAFLYASFLEKACQVQVKALASGRPLVVPSPEICEKAARDLREFEPDFGCRDWAALKRKLDYGQTRTLI
jgi:ribulose-5-phosphate 4-epimerase/fuculose-1-phosphate aldolase